MFALLLACTTGALIDGSKVATPSDTAADTEAPDPGGDDTEGGMDTEPPDPPVAPELSVVAPPAWDALLTGALAFEVGADQGGAYALELYDEGGARIWTAAGELAAGEVAEARWEDAAVANTGLLSWRVAFEAAETGLTDEQAGEIAAVRCGFTAAWTEQDEGETALQIPLYWHLSMTLQDPARALVTLAGLEDDEGAPLDFPPPTDELSIHYNTDEMVEPSGWTWDSRPMLSLLVGEGSQLGGLGLEGAEISLEVEGWTVLSEGPLAPGEHVLIQRDAPLSDFLGVVEETLELRFVAADPAGGEGWALGSQALPLRMYALYGEPSFEREGPVYCPWVAAIDPALRAIDGVEPDPEAVLDALVEWIFNDLGLTYDTRYGASSYASYRGGWDTGHFNMTDFLTLRFGEVVNCSDCAGILTSYANMLGARLAYLTILRNFSLNEILAIGQEEYTSCPFGPSSCGFSYHAVTTTGGAEWIWDATLALDGDEDPGSEPWEVMMVEKVAGEEYLERLVRSGDATYDYETIGTLQ